MLSSSLPSFSYLPSLGGDVDFKGRLSLGKVGGEVMRSMFWFVSFFFVPLCLEMVVIGVEGLFPVSAYSY